MSFRINEKLFLRDPQATALGQGIISKSVVLIDKLGFEQFTFKKLAEEINSTEASVYRYFENKHRLLLYLLDWYWSWLEYRIDLSATSIKDPSERLRLSLKILSEEKKYDPTFEFVDEAVLYRIVLSEMDKTYQTKQVDDHNKIGFYFEHKSLCKKIANMVKEINPNYPFPHSLISMVMLSANQQVFYAQHLPSLTDIKLNPEKQYEQLYTFLETLVFKTIAPTLTKTENDDQ